ncbi:MAG: hypothetical protein ACRBCL_07700 [Maritimibacter sp.]
MAGAIKTAVLFGAFVLGAGGGAMAQPYSTSLAQCAGILQSAGDVINDDVATPIYAENAYTFWEAAIAQAGKEGHANAEEVAMAAYAPTYETWRQRGPMAYVKGEFGDWMSYCRKFAKNQGLTLVWLTR